MTNKRIPHNNLYDIFLTLIFSSAFIIMIYSLTPTKKYDIYYKYPNQNQY